MRKILGSTLILVSALTAIGTAPASADDRDILRDSSSKPYLFVILDTSGSMNWSPQCTAADVTAGNCTYRCDSGDCAVPRDGDDPASKFRQAKEALYEVLRDVDDIDLGFSTYNQDDLRVTNKHWLYRVRSGEPQITLLSGAKFPTYGSEEVFGATIGCDRGNGNDNEMGCFADSDRAADTNDTWETTKVRRLPKLGTNGSTAVSFYIRNSGQVYYVTYDDPGSSQTFGGAITVRVRVDRCTGSPASNPSNGCNAGSERTLVDQKDIKFDVIGDFVLWDFQVTRNSSQGGYFGTQFSNSGNTCASWEVNSDSTSDDWNDGNGHTYNLKRPNGALFYDPSGTANDWRFQPGDTIPLNWAGSNRNAILDRLAPRLNGGDPATDPEAFGNATYLNNDRIGTEGFLRRSNANYYPLIPSGSTPLGASLRSFRDWYRGCPNTTASCNNTGWDDYAASEDPKWGCRQKFILVLTDGDETCSGDPCGYAGVLHDNDGVSTYVIAFGVPAGGGNFLNCMASEGGTGSPIYPQNKQQLVDALKSILSNIREQAAAFASAAVPQVQANATDKIFLSSFTPLDEEGYWAGRMDAFLKPLPLNAQGQPDRSIPCSGSVKSACWLWDAGDVQEGQLGGGGTYSPQGLLLQAPHPDDVSPEPPFVASDLLLGVGANERRVVYSQFSEAGNRRLFTYPTSNAQKYDLWNGLELSYIVGNSASEDAADLAANRIIVTTLLEKEATVDIPDPDNPGSFIQEPITYLLGDIFHADPVVLGRPTDFAAYTHDPYLGRRLCGADPDPTRSPPPSYRWFADRYFCRRSVLFTAANDGQLHAFDSGVFGSAGGGTVECLLPAKDLDGDGVAEEDEFEDGIVDYDLSDDIDGNKSCSSDSDCASGPCSGGFCRDVRVGIIDGAYSNGTGKEIFSFIPRAMLPTVRKAATGSDRNTEFWGMDGGPRVRDVFIDPLASDTGSVTCLDREWRTVAIGGYREGGSGYYALDITQPDVLDADHVPQPDNGYVPSCFDGGSGCPRPYPSVLWEFQDHELVDISGSGTIDVALDEDLNDVADLGNSWSKASVGRIRVCTGACGDDDQEDRWVAIFGGGIGDDPADETGNFVYMVDIETGRVLYKKQVIGSVPADIAAVDSNGDNYTDRLYFGTTAGLLYKVQLETGVDAPLRIVNSTFTTRVAGVDRTFTADRILGPVGNLTKYDPFQVFSTGSRPIYLEAAVINVASTNRLAVAFGTGNRWDLWNFSGQSGRFYVILDDNFADTDGDGVLDVSCGGCTEPLTESKYYAIAPGDSRGTTNLLYDGDGTGSLPGWYLTLDDNEKIITEAFSLSGITIFTSFVPTEVSNADGTCTRAGSSRVFVVGTVTAAGYAENLDRYEEIPQFTTPPFVEQSATKNPEGGGAGTQHADYITDALAQIRDELKSLQSSRCRYANYTMNIKTIRSDTGVVFIAPVPLCIDPTSWKEF